MLPSLAGMWRQRSRERRTKPTSMAWAVQRDMPSRRSPRGNLIFDSELVGVLRELLMAGGGSKGGEGREGVDAFGGRVGGRFGGSFEMNLGAASQEVLGEHDEAGKGVLLRREGGLRGSNRCAQEGEGRRETEADFGLFQDVRWKLWMWMEMEMEIGCGCGCEVGGTCATYT